MFDRRRFCLVFTLALGLASPSFPRAQSAPPAHALVGTWDGNYEPPGVVGGDPLSLLVTSIEGERVRGSLVLPTGALEFEGSLAGSGLRFDMRSLGWEDFFADVPASGETCYRWTSISKPLTATPR